MLTAEKTKINLNKQDKSIIKKFNFRKKIKSLIIASIITSLSAGFLFANVGYKTGQVYEYNNKYFSKITNYSEMKQRYSSFTYTNEQYKKDTEFFSYFFSQNFPTYDFKETNEKNEHSLSYTYYANNLNDLAMSYMINRGDYKNVNSIINKFKINKDLDEKSYLNYIMDMSDLRKHNNKIYQKTIIENNPVQYQEYKKLISSSVDSSYTEPGNVTIPVPDGQFYMSFTSKNIIENYNQLLKDNNVHLSFLDIEKYNKQKYKLKDGYKGNPNDNKAVFQDKQATMNLYKKYNPEFIEFREKWNNNTLTEKEKYDFLKTMSFINSLYTNNGPHVSSWLNKIYTPSDFLTEFWNIYYNKKYNIPEDEQIFYM